MYTADERSNLERKWDFGWWCWSILGWFSPCTRTSGFTLHYFCIVFKIL